MISATSSGTHGFFLRDFGDPQKAFPIMGLSDATIESKWFFQFVFCAVSLAIVWGTTLERIKFGVYVIYAVVFSALIYPIASGWVFGGGWLQVNVGMQDFAGSTAVHLIGATGALAALLLLGPRRGKYDPDGKAAGDPRPQHAALRARRADPVAGLVRLQPGLDARRARRPLHRGRCSSPSSRPAAGVLGALITARLKTGRSTSAWPATARSRALVAITAPSGYVAPWAGVVIGFVAGVIVVLGVYAIDSKLDDPVGALSAHGLAASGARCRAASSRCRRWRRTTPSASRGLFYSGSFHQLGAQALGVVTVFAFVFAASYAHLLAHQEDLRPARDRRGGGRRPRHLRARHVRLSRAVHPDPGARGLRCGSARGHAGNGRCDPDPDHSGGDGVKKVEAYIRHEAFEPIRMELLTLGFPSLSISEVKGSGRQKGITERYRGAELTNYLRPKVKLECVVADRDVQTIVDTILKHARTGAVGDGKVFVLPGGGELPRPDR